MRTRKQELRVKPWQNDRPESDWYGRAFSLGSLTLLSGAETE